MTNMLNLKISTDRSKHSDDDSVTKGQLRYNTSMSAGLVMFHFHRYLSMPDFLISNNNSLHHLFYIYNYIYAEMRATSKLGNRALGSRSAEAPHS